MSIVFLKSEDKQGGGSDNPNKPWRFSNYLTQPIRLPPNSQVSYVSSQYTLETDIFMNDQASYIQTEKNDSSVLSMPVQVSYNTNSVQGTIYEKVNRYILSANEFGMDGDYTGLKYETQSFFVHPQEVSNTGFQLLYDAGNEKVEIRAYTQIALDQYNLHFNCAGTNPAFVSTSWVGGDGASVPSGINWTNKADDKFKSDLAFVNVNDPAGDCVFGDIECFGFETGVFTGPGNSISQIYNGGANFYNTGFSTTGLVSNSNYDYLQPANLTDFPEFDIQSYPMSILTTGIKRSIGTFTPSSSEQQSNTGGHVTPGAFSTPSGGYSIVGFSNTNKSRANSHYDATSTNRLGYSGIGIQHIGVQSIPYIRSFGYKKALEEGFPENIARDRDFQLQKALESIDLNGSDNPQIPQGNLARYLFGLYIFDDDSLGTNDIRQKVQAEVLSPAGLGNLKNMQNSDYEDLGNALDIYELSRGTNTAVNPPYQFDATADYSINTYAVGGKTPAALFFRFRWVNKNQMAIEFTLSVDGYAGTYDANTDSIFEPAGYLPPSPSVPPGTQTIALDGTTDGTTIAILQNTRFTDSGGTGGDYQPGESYDIIFDAGAGLNAGFTINDFFFEQSSSQLYDRLGVQSSSDGITWTNVSFAGFNSSANATAPWSTSYGTPAQPGWIFPAAPSTIDLRGGNSAATYDVGARYARFTFVSDGSVQFDGWDLNIIGLDPAGITDVNDPRDKWCLLATMNASSKQYIIPSYMGDIGLVQYPVAGVTNPGELRLLHKGWYEPRMTNRCFESNNNGGNKQYLPFSYDNPFFDDIYSGTLVYDIDNPNDKTITSSNLVESGYAGDIKTFNTDGILDNEVYYLSVPSRYLERDLFLMMNGFYAFEEGKPDTEAGYVLGFREISDPDAVVKLVEDELESGLFTLVGEHTIQPSENSFTNHIQLTNLPIVSQNGVVSSVAKTIYIANTLGVATTQDQGSYRFFSDRSPYPMWIDLNNLETIELNKIDVLITDDNNITQRSLGGTTELVVMFRQKETGTLPNTIPVNSMSITRTY